MSCGSQRTAYDMQMAERYDPTREGYNAPPWPGLRTAYDKDLQNKWCPGCTFKEGYKRGGHRREGYAMTYSNPRYNFRTAYDNALQQAWCPSCSSGPQPGPPGPTPTPSPTPPTPQPPRPSPSGPPGPTGMPNMRNIESYTREKYTREKYASLLDDPDNIYSYALGGKQCGV